LANIRADYPRPGLAGQAPRTGQSTFDRTTPPAPASPLAHYRDLSGEPESPGSKDQAKDQVQDKALDHYRDLLDEPGLLSQARRDRSGDRER
jgi:hypothetical protein